MKNSLIILLAASALLTSCASYEPVLDYNEKYKMVGDDQAERDIDACEKSADEYLKNKKEEEAQKPPGRETVGSGVSPKEAKQAFMKKCLEDQKYQVLGWE